MRTGQGELANRRIQPLCHLSAACFKQLTTLIWPISFTVGGRGSVLKRPATILSLGIDCDRFKAKH
jgi:hypothetical protein